jgi:hypothetical protein
MSHNLVDVKARQGRIMHTHASCSVPVPRPRAVYSRFSRALAPPSGDRHTRSSDDMRCGCGVNHLSLVALDIRTACVEVWSSCERLVLVGVVFGKCRACVSGLSLRVWKCKSGMTAGSAAVLHFAPREKRWSDTRKNI